MLAAAGGSYERLLAASVSIPKTRAGRRRTSNWPPEGVESRYLRKRNGERTADEEVSTLSAVAKERAA